MENNDCKELKDLKKKVATLEKDLTELKKQLNIIVRAFGGTK